MSEDKLNHITNYYLGLIQSCLTGSIYRDISKAPFGSNSFDLHRRTQGLDWPAHAQTMIGEKRLANLRELTESVIAEKVPGDLIETGVWRGGACILMRAVLFAHGITDRNVWVADSFQGLPIANEIQYPADAGSTFHTFQELAVPLDEVKENFRAYGFLDTQTKFLDGWFKDTLSSAQIGPLALMRLDGDMYESTMDALINLYPKLSLHGYVIIDDYHVIPACKAAVHDYCDRNGVAPDIIEIDGVGVYWRKPGVSGQKKFIEVPSQLVASSEVQLSRLNDAVIEVSRNIIDHLHRSLTERDSEAAKFSKILNERDVTIAALNQTLTERDAAAAYTKAELFALHSSLSWRITKPVRAIKNITDAMVSTAHNSRFEEIVVNQPPLQHSSAEKGSSNLNDRILQSKTETRHNYEYEVDLASDTAAAKVVRMVGHNKRVLEIGAGPGSITKILKQNNGCRVTGVEIDSSAIAKLSQYCESVYQCDLNDSHWASDLSGCGTYDVIVAADVFEHLYNPTSTLTALKSFFAPDGYLVVSLPHVGNNALIASILNNDFEYRDYGLLDRTHIRFFGIKNMQQFVECSGYKIISAEFVIIPPGLTELAAQWKNIPDIFKNALIRNPYGLVYQVVMKVAPAESGVVGIQLTDIPVPAYVTTPLESLRSWLGPYLSEKIHRFFLRLKL